MNKLRKVKDEPRFAKRHIALASLASIEYTREFAPYLIEVARLILTQSSADPFFKASFRTLNWYKVVTKIESPVFTLIMNQEQWLLERHMQTLSVPEYIPPVANRNLWDRDPKWQILQAWIQDADFSNKSDYIPGFLEQLGSSISTDTFQNLLLEIMLGLG